MKNIILKKNILNKIMKKYMFAKIKIQKDNYIKK